MNLAKALGLGILLYVILFLVATTVMYALGIPFVGQVLVVAAPLFSIPIVYIYLMGFSEKQFLESIELGFFWIILSLLLDMGVFVYLFESGWDYFNSPLVWLRYGELIFFNAIIGGLVEGTQEKTPLKEHKNTGV